ncbi:MAG: hypothetical protein WAU32_01510 [Thermoanaerobaculia bacterium]
MQLRKFPSAALALAFAAAILTPGDARACSICRCGDPTFNALGSNVYADGAFHLALDWDRFDKEQGVFAQRGETETLLENRVTATLSYAFAQRFNVVARIPYSVKSLTEGETVTDTHGFADPEIYALVRLWSSSFGPGLGRRTWLSALFGVKTPWGQNDVQHDGVRVDEHSQPGTGSTDLFGGLSFLHLFDEKSALFASVQYRGTGRNDFGYKYGNITLANVAYERKIFEPLDAVVELNYRYAGKDQVDVEGVQDLNTGGSILYITPRLLFSITERLVARVSVLIPTWKALNGQQTEKAVYNAGLTYVF